MHSNPRPSSKYLIYFKHFFYFSDTVPVDKKWSELITYNIFIMKLVEFVSIIQTDYRKPSYIEFKGSTCIKLQ